MKKVFILYLIISFPLLSFCQTWEWAKSYGNSYNDLGLSIGIDKSNNLYVTGFNRLPGSGPNPGYWHELLYKFNNKGERVWTDTIPFFMSKVITDKEGNCYVYNAPMYNNGRIGKYDSNGNQLWIKQIINTILSDVKLFPNGDVVIAGYNNSGSNVTVGNVVVPNDHGFIAKGDENLNWQWIKTQYLYNPDAIAISHDNKIHIFGISIDSSNKSCVRIFDNNGNYLKGFVESNSRDKCLITVDKEDNFYIGSVTTKWNTLTINGDTIPCNSNECGYILKFNSEGVFQWRKIVGQNVDLVSLQSDNDNNVYIVGNIMRTLQLDSIFLDQHLGEAYVVKFNPKGNMLWLKHSERIVGGSNAGVSDMILDSENDPIITGSLGGQHKFGDITLTNHCCTWSDLLIAKIKQEPVKVIENELYNLYGLIVYPNPTQSIFTVFYNTEYLTPITLSITNQLGQTILSKEYSARTQLKETFDLNWLAKGIYFIELNADDKKEVKKIVVQ